MTLLPNPSAPLAADEAARAFDLLFDADLSDEAIAGFLVTMARRGETATEIAAAARALGVEPQRLIKLVIAPGDAQQQLDQGCRWLRRQVRLDLTPRIPPPGSCRCCLGFVRRGLICRACYNLRILCGPSQHHHKTF